MNEFLKIDKRITDASDNALKLCKKQFEYIDEITEYNQQKVQKAFIDNRISESHFCTSTGYGYGDIGREALDKVWAQVLGAESALVRHNFTCGTHTLATALFVNCVFYCLIVKAFVFKCHFLIFNSEILKRTHSFTADLIAGSMIKNAGGGIATTGGYIAGRKDLVEKCAYRLTTPGLGSEVGATIGMNRQLYMGLFFAPHTVGEALKCAVYISALYESFGYDVTPRYKEIRHDIVQSMGLENAESLVAFCQGIQSGSPIDSYLLPEPWVMPGYEPRVNAPAAITTLLSYPGISQGSGKR